MTADTIFRIYSMTKPVVSTALMMLHEEGCFQLEHPVAQYLPAFGSTKVLAEDGTLVDQARPMQIRDLLTHTSGLTYDFMADNPVGRRAGRGVHDPVHDRGAAPRPRLPVARVPGDRRLMVVRR